MARPTAPSPTIRRPACELPTAEPLVRETAVFDDLARSKIPVGLDQAARGCEQQAHGHLGDRVGVAPRGVQHGDATRRGTWYIDVARVAARGGDGSQRQIEHGAHTEIRFADQDLRALALRPLGEIVRAIDAQRVLIDP